MAGEQRQYRDPQRLTQWLCRLLVATILIHVLSGLNALLQAYVIGAISDGRIPSSSVMMIATEANRFLRQNPFRTVASLALIGTMVLWLVWTYRINSNVHALVGHGLRFAPGWAVGWHFIPIANLWKPYQAMSEIWRASKNPARWQLESASGLLGGGSDGWHSWLSAMFRCGALSSRSGMTA